MDRNHGQLLYLCNNRAVTRGKGGIQNDRGDNGHDESEGSVVVELRSLCVSLFAQLTWLSGQKLCTTSVTMQQQGIVRWKGGIHNDPLDGGRDGTEEPNQRSS